MEHIIDEADPEVTYCDRWVTLVDTAVTVDEIDHDSVCYDCITALNDRY